MLYQTDTVMRMFEMVGLAIRRLLEIALGESEGQKYEYTQKLLDDAMRRYAGLSRDGLLGMPMETLFALLSPERAIAASELLYAQAQQYEDVLEPAAQRCMERSLQLLGRVSVDSELARALYPRICTLHRDMQQITPDMLRQLARLYETAGQFAVAENTWEELFGAPGGVFAYGAEVEDFYVRLLALSDGRLLSGELPRQEVLDGLARARGLRNPARA